MILYNVTVKVDESIAAQWVQWMQGEHMPELMQTGLFVDSKLFRLLDIDESDGLTYAAQYFCNSKAEYDKYIDEHAPVMRAKGIERFGDKFIAFRTLMETVE
jgi:hypothetical protein